MQTNNNNSRRAIESEVKRIWEDQGLTVNGRQVGETYQLAEVYCDERAERFNGIPALFLCDVWYERGFEVADLWTV